jgi:hypothetical protein
VIRFQRTFDLDLVRSIMTRPEIYAGLSDDFYPSAEEFRPNGSEAVVYLIAYDDVKQDGELLGLFITHPINAVLWETHHALLPICWGARAHQVGVAFERWLWANTQAQTALGFTPECNRLAVRFARRHGLKECGRIPSGYQKGGVLCDLLVFSKTRPIDDTRQLSG